MKLEEIKVHHIIKMEARYHIKTQCKDLNLEMIINSSSGNINSNCYNISSNHTSSQTSIKNNFSSKFQITSETKYSMEKKIELVMIKYSFSDNKVNNKKSFRVRWMYRKRLFNKIHDKCLETLVQIWLKIPNLRRQVIKSAKNKSSILNYKAS